MTIFDNPTETKSPLDNTVDLGGYELLFKNYYKVQAPNILCELWNLCYPGKTIRFESKQFLQLNLIVSDLYSCHCSDYEFVRYSRTREDYTGSSNLSYRIALNIIDILIENDYVFSIIGQQLAQRTSRMKATDKLIDLIGDHSLVLNRKISPDDNFVILRSEKEKLEGRAKKVAHDLSYNPNDFTIKNNKFLFDYNTLVSNTSFKVGDEFNHIISFDRNVMKTVFNDGSFSKGGRFCGTWWLECKSKIRKSILIDNEETCEIDYKCSHPTIAYAKKGIDVSNQDLYAVNTIDNYQEHRKLIKKVLLTCLNAVSKNSAAKAIETNFLEYTIKKHKKRKENKILKKHPDYTVYQIINLIKEFHPNIQEFLYNDSGKNLMFLEREIVFDVLNHFLKKDILVLPVHDSFVIKKKYQKELEEVMLSIFKTKMNVNINIETITKNTNILSSNSSNIYSKSYNPISSNSYNLISSNSSNIYSKSYNPISSNSSNIYSKSYNPISSNSSNIYSNSYNLISSNSSNIYSNSSNIYSNSSNIYSKSYNPISYNSSNISSNIYSKSYNLTNTTNNKESSYHYVSRNVLIETDTNSIDNSTNVMGNVFKKDCVSNKKVTNLDVVRNVFKKDSVNLDVVNNVFKKDLDVSHNVFKKDSVNLLSTDECLGFFGIDDNEQPTKKKETPMSLKKTFESKSAEVQEALLALPRELTEQYLKKMAVDPTFFSDEEIIEDYKAQTPEKEEDSFFDFVKQPKKEWSEEELAIARREHREEEKRRNDESNRHRLVQFKNIRI